MDKILTRLSADIADHYKAMKVFALTFGLPYVEDDLIEYMEFWINTETRTLTITLVTNEREFHFLAEKL